MRVFYNVYKNKGKLESYFTFLVLTQYVWHWHYMILDLVSWMELSWCLSDFSCLSQLAVGRSLTLSTILDIKSLHGCQLLEQNNSCHVPRVILQFLDWLLLQPWLDWFWVFYHGPTPTSDRWIRKAIQIYKYNIVCIHRQIFATPVHSDIKMYEKRYKYAKYAEYCCIMFLFVLLYIFYDKEEGRHACSYWACYWAG